MNPCSLLEALGPEIEDPEEEAFLLFSQSIPSQNLGFVDPKATDLSFSIGSRDISIHQSPTILSSNRGGGTTGAVVWKISPLFASWICSPSNLLFKHHVLHSNALVLELGCGISGIIALALSPMIKSYILTDQPYVLKLLKQNLSENSQYVSASSSQGRKPSAKRGSAPANIAQNASNILAKSLDWETDQVTPSLTPSNGNDGFDVLIACDCIYNDALIDPFVQTCVDVCQLRSKHEAEEPAKPTLCIVAQQLRSNEVFEAWLKAFHKAFKVWRLPDEELIDGLKTDTGFVVHIGMLK